MEKSDIDSFYQEVKDVVEGSPLSISPVGRTVALFRLTLEYGAMHMGLPTVSYLLSRTLTITLGILAGDEESSYDDILEEFDTEDHVKH